MSEDKGKKAEKTEKPAAPTVESRLTTLENRVGFLMRKLEQVFGLDLNNDGKIGGVRVALLFVLALAITSTVFAASEIIRWTGTNQNYVAVMDDGSIRSVSATVTNDYPAAGGFTSATLVGQTNGVISAITLQTTNLTYLSATDVTNTITVVTNVTQTTRMVLTNGTITLQ